MIEQSNRKGYPDVETIVADVRDLRCPATALTWSLSMHAMATLLTRADAISSANRLPEKAGLKVSKI
jgi:hypothetical protein